MVNESTQRENSGTRVRSRGSGHLSPRKLQPAFRPDSVLTQVARLMIPYSAGGAGGGGGGKEGARLQHREGGSQWPLSQRALTPFSSLA